MCSRSVAFVAFSNGKPISTFPENALSSVILVVPAKAGATLLTLRFPLSTKKRPLGA
jgi:hypothetical protein